MKTRMNARSGLVLLAAAATTVSVMLAAVAFRGALEGIDGPSVSGTLGACAQALFDVAESSFDIFAESIGELVTRDFWLSLVGAPGETGAPWE